MALPVVSDSWCTASQMERPPYQKPTRSEPPEERKDPVRELDAQARRIHLRRFALDDGGKDV